MLTPRFLFLAAILLCAGTPVHAQTIYRTVGADGKVTFSDVPPTGSHNRDIRSYSSSALSQSNIVGQPEPGAHSRFYNQCRPDWQRFCITSTSENQALQCLLDRQQQVSDGCYEAMKQQMSSGGNNSTGSRSPENNRSDNPLQACQQDSQHLCKGIQPGGGRVMNCLLDHQNELSDACYSTLEKQMRKKNSAR